MSTQTQGTMKVKPWHQSQGDFVVIDADQFDPDFHEKFEEPAAEATEAEATKPARKK